MSSHEAIAALPTGADADAALIRAMCTRRFAYVLAADEPATSFVAVDPTSGVVPLYLIQNSTLFAYDSTDSTTVHDGVTCLVSSDGKRFKSETIAPPYSVLDKDLIAQPVSPAVGDRYLIPTAATGTDWAGQDGKIGIYTAAGWRFAISPVGRLLHVEDETAFYHRNVSGTWAAGLGSIVLDANSVNITNVLGAKASFVVKVENQTTNAPPASPVAPVAYVIGSSPTGDWSGNAGKLAICLTDGAFTIITPDEGDQVYDKSTQNNYRFDGSAWIPSSGSVVNYKYQETDASATNNTGTNAYTQSATAPVSNVIGFYDPATISYASKKTGALLRITYRAAIDPTGYLTQATAGPDTFPTSALFRDALTNAVDWHAHPVPISATQQITSVDVQFLVTTPDALSHTYKIATLMFRVTNVIYFPTVLYRRRILIEEFA